MRQAALKGLVVGLIWAGGVLSIRPSVQLGCMIAEFIHPHVIYLNVR